MSDEQGRETEGTDDRLPTSAELLDMLGFGDPEVEGPDASEPVEGE